MPKPAQVLRKYASLVRPGGVVAMMEYEMAAAGTLPPTELATRVIFWLTEAFRRSGLDPSLGARLAEVMADAGLDEATVLGLQGYRAVGDRDGTRMAAQIMRTLQPVLEKTGVTTPEELDIETLEDRLRRECVRHNAIFKPPTLVGAWAKVA
jgi:hypothetical protein